jgi:hypothetical protein
VSFALNQKFSELSEVLKNLRILSKDLLTGCSGPPEIRRSAAFGERKKKMKREGFLLVPPWRMALVYPPKLKTTLKNFEQFVKMYLSGGFQILWLYSLL